MIFYEILTLFKFTAYLRDLKTGLNIFYAASITQLFLGIFLILLSTKIFLKFKSNVIETDVNF